MSMTDWVISLTERTEYGEGYDACQAGKARSECPYPNGDARDAWLLGYQDAELEEAEDGP
jgi:ribosome modulation factor